MSNLPNYFSRHCRIFSLIFLVNILGICNITFANNSTLNVGTPNDPSVDPHWLYLGPNAAYSRYIFERLVDRDANANIIPALAQSWEVIDDLTWQFNLRKNVKFHDGTNFTAKDFIFSVNRIPNIPNNPASYEPNTRMIESISSPDDHTLIIKTKNPYPLLLRRISGIAIVSEKVSRESVTEDFASGKVAIGTGPYKFKEYLPGDRYSLVRNENYWGIKPDFKEVNFKIMPDSASRLAALFAGDIDIVEGLSPTAVPTVQKRKGFDVAKRSSARTLWLYIDVQNDSSPFVTDLAGNPMAVNPLKDLRVRQALSKAINRDAIVDRVMEGLAEKANQVVPKGFFSYNDAINDEEFNPEISRKLLAESGYPQGFGLTIHAPNDRYVNDAKIAQAIAQMLSRIGLKMKVETMPKAVYFGKLNKQEFSLSMIGWDNAFTGSSLMSLSAAFHSKTDGRGGWNAGGYSNPEFDKLVDSASKTFDTEMYENYLKDAMKILIKDDQGAIPLHSQFVTLGVKDTISYTPRMDEGFQATLVKQK